MSRPFLTILLCSSLLVLGACAPAITVSNNTTIPVRVIVVANGVAQTLSPSPGESSIAEVSEGTYAASVLPDAEWISYAQAVRKDLNEQLANSDSLSGAKLLDVIRRLKDIAQRMSQFQAAAGSQATCSGALSEDKNSVVTVSIGANGALAISCR